MSVLVGGFTYIVSVPLLMERYPGGLSAYRAECVNASFCSDGLITRVSFGRATTEDGELMEHLLSLGLQPNGGDGLGGFTIFEASGELPEECRWLNSRRHPSGYAYVWDARHDPGRLAVPEGWTPDHPQAARFGFDHVEPETGYHWHGSLRGLCVYQDGATGHTVLLGRVNDMDAFFALAQLRGRRDDEDAKRRRQRDGG